MKLLDTFREVLGVQLPEEAEDFLSICENCLDIIKKKSTAVD